MFCEPIILHFLIFDVRSAGFEQMQKMTESDISSFCVFVQCQVFEAQ